MSIIDAYIASYIKNREIYVKIEKHVHSLIESELRDSGIISIVTSRTKEISRLIDKVNLRNHEKKYLCIFDIQNDIIDLIGVRIALYFPDDEKKVETLILKMFEISSKKNFPEDQKESKIYKRRFIGYRATHFRVFLKESIKEIKSSNEYIIEIQVASLLMHAWSEVEHDLTYKQMKGIVSYDELETLDEINGLVLAGELSLQRLQRISEQRILSENKEFTNHYQLASYLYDKIVAQTNKNTFLLGDVETLYRVLADQKRLTPRKISNDLEKITITEIKPIAQQIIDMYTSGNKRLTSLAIQSNVRKNYPNNQTSTTEHLLGTFVNKWVTLENALFVLSPPMNTKRNGGMLRHVLANLVGTGYITNDFINEYMQLKEIRNALVHGREGIDDISLEDSIKRLDALHATLDLQTAYIRNEL